MVRKQSKEQKTIKIPQQRKTTLKWGSNGELSALDMVRILDSLNDQELTECEITSETEKNPYSRYPSWAVIKKHSTNNLRPSQQLIKKGLRARRHSISEQIKILIKNLVKRVLSRSLLNIIRRFLRR